MDETNILPHHWKGRVNVTSTCWDWTGCHSTNGYGKVSFNNKSDYAHRVIWQLVFGPIPDGLFVCHHCDNKSCVNPDHLFLGTPNDNIQDAVKKGRTAKGEARPDSVLTEADVIAIRSSNLTHTELAKKFGICRQHVSDVQRGIKWGHLGGVRDEKLERSKKMLRRKQLLDEI